MEKELYQHAQDIFSRLYEKTAIKLLTEKKEGKYTHEEFYDLNIGVIRHICNSIHAKNRGIIGLQSSLKENLTRQFEKYNQDTIYYLKNSLQQYADNFCDTKKIPRVKVILPSLGTTRLPAGLKITMKEIVIQRSSSDCSRWFLENGLDHELRHHYMISKCSFTKYLGSPLNYMLSLILLTAGGVSHNTYHLYDIGSLILSTSLATEIYADLPRRKYVLAEIGIASIPWIIKLVLNL